MTDREDPEIVAMRAVLRAISNLERAVQHRILRYAAERVDEDLKFNLEDFVVNVGKGMEAINEAARKTGVRGIDMISVLLSAYESAAVAVDPPTDTADPS